MSVDLLKPCYCPCLEILSENFSFPGNRHLDSTITAWKLWSPRLMSACTWAMPQALSVPASYNPFRRLFFFLSLLPLQVTSQSWLVSRASKAWWEYSSPLMARVWWAVSKEPQCRAWWSPTQPCLLIRCVPAAGKAWPQAPALQIKHYRTFPVMGG